MGQFLRSWRRNAGYGALIIALVFTSTWFSRRAHSPVVEPITTQVVKADEFHRLIRDAEMLQRSLAIGREWTEVRARFEAAGYQRIFANGDQHTTSYTYLIRSAAWSASSEPSYDLIVQVTVDKRDSQDVSGAKPNEVIGVSTGLLAKTNIAFDALTRAGIYSSDSSLGRCFATVEFQEALKRYRFIKQVEVTYDLVRDRWRETIPYGFHVRFKLGNRADRDDRGMQLFFTVESGLDSLQDWSGHTLADADEPRPVFDEVRYWGSNEWAQL